MYRRQVLALCWTIVVSLTGCVSDGAETDADPSPSPPETPSTDLSDHDNCPRSPDVAGLPERPAELETESVTEFLTEYEYTLAPALNPEYSRLNYIEHTRTEQIAESYRVHFFVEPFSEHSPATSTDKTPTLITAGTYNVAYYIDDTQIRRTTRVGPTSYTGLQPRENGTLIAC